MAGDGGVPDGVDERAMRRKLQEEYRVACPRGHTSLHPAETTPTAYCKTCGRAYDFADLCDRLGDERSRREHP